MFVNISSWVLWVLTAAIALYWYLTKKHNHWKDRGVPYVPAVPVLGSMWTFFFSFGKAIYEIELERFLTKGPIYGTYEGRNPVLTVGDPDALRDIMVKDFQFFTDRRDMSMGNDDNLTKYMLASVNGITWKRIRTLITPAFTTGKIKKMTSIFTDSAKTLSDNLKKAAVEEKPLDLKRYFGAFTMDVIASCAFAIKLDSHSDPGNPFVTHAKGFFGGNLTWRLLLLIIFPSFLKFFDLSPFPTAPMDFFKEVTLKLVKERKQSGKKRNDFLQLMIDAENEMEKEESTADKDPASEIGQEENSNEVLKPERSFKSLSHNEMVAQCVSFFLGGYETTAATLAVAAYELACNPEIQDKLISEIDEAITEKGGLTYEAVSEMKYLDCVVAETLRKYPPAARSERVARDDYTIKNHSITVTKGTIIGIPIYAMHHCPENYPNPGKFDPDRFTPEMKASRHPFAYLPFGAGPRNCVALRFALIEIKVCLAYVLSQFRFHTCSQTEQPLKLYFAQGVLTPNEVMLKIELRTDFVLL